MDSIAGKSISLKEKLTLFNKQLSQPSKAVLSKRKKKISKRDRCCSKDFFRHKNGSKRSWLTYSFDSDALYFIPFLLFSDEVLSGRGQQKNQSNAFIKAFFSNWKKQFEHVRMHEECEPHINSKIAEVMLLQKKSMRDIPEAQENVQEEARQQHAEANRKILKLIDMIIFWASKNSLLWSSRIVSKWSFR